MCGEENECPQSFTDVSCFPGGSCLCIGTHIKLPDSHNIYSWKYRNTEIQKNRNTEIQKSNTETFETQICKKQKALESAPVSASVYQHTYKTATIFTATNIETQKYRSTEIQTNQKYRYARKLWH